MSLAPKLFLRVSLILAVFFCFTADLFAQNFLPGYEYRGFIQVDNALITGSHTDFPVLVNLTLDPNDVYSTSGFDIAFGIDDASIPPTQLSHELVSWNDGTGELVAWVKLPILNTTNNSFYIYYGNSSISSDQSTSDVWSNGYEGVWGMEDVLDGTANGNNATDNGTSVVTGKIGSARDFDGVSDYLEVPYDASFDVTGTALTISAWINSDFPQAASNAANDVVGVYVHGNGTGGALAEDVTRGLLLDLPTPNDVRVALTSGGVLNIDIDDDADFPESQWFYYTFTYNGSDVNLYQGNAGTGTLTLSGTTTLNTDIDAALATSAFIGRNKNTSTASNFEYFDGRLDHVSISSISRSLSWITTEFENQNDPTAGGFFSTITVKLAGGCNGAVPTASATPSSEVICSNDFSTNINVTGTNVDQYRLIRSPGPDVALVTPDPDDFTNDFDMIVGSASFTISDVWNYTGAGAAGTVTYTIYPSNSVSGCVGDPETVTVTVYPEVTTLVPTDPPDVCDGETFTIDIVGSQSGINYQLWDDTNNVALSAIVTGGGNISLTSIPLTTIGVADLKVIATNPLASCSKDLIPADDSFEVFAIPADPTVTFSTDTYCESDAFDETPTERPQVTSGTSNLQWYDESFVLLAPQPSNLSNPTNADLGWTTTSSGLYTRYVTQTVNGCESGFTAVTLLVNPTPDLTKTYSATDGCVGSPITATVNNIESGISYQIYIDGAPSGSALTGSAGSNLLLTSANVASSGTKAIRILATDILTSCNSLLNDLTITSDVFDQPVADAGLDQVVCGLSTTMAGTASVGTGAWTVVSEPFPGATNPGFGTPSSATSSLTVSATGTYVFRWTEDIGSGTCIDSDEVTVVFNPVPNPVIDSSPTGSDFDVCAGELATYEIGAIAGTSYAWTVTGGAISGPSNSNQIDVLWGAGASGIISVVQTYIATGCSASSGPVAVTINTVSVSGTVSSSVGGGFNLDCNGDTDGTIDITPSGGSGSYTYAWSTLDGSGLIPANQDQTGLSAGTYTVLITDTNSPGCTVTENYSLTEPTALNVVATTVTDVSCNGDTDGAIDITVTGGEGVYTFAWSGTGTGIVVGDEDQTGLSAGTYDVTVTDGNGCTFDLLGIVVNEPAAIVITPTLSISTGGGFNLECNGDSDGTIDLAIAGGTAPFSYSWTTGDGSGLNPTAEDQIGLTAGTYDVTVTDANGCMQMGSYTLTEPTAVAITLDNISMSVGGGFNLDCNGDTDGVIEITPGGGEGGYTYAWTGPGVNPTSQDQSNLGAGSYSVTVTDGNGCTAVANYSLTEPTALNVVATTVTDVSCNGDTDGAIDITVTGGEGVYTFAWSGTGTGIVVGDEDQTGLSAGTYDVTVTDGNGCTFDLLGIVVNEPAAIVITPMLSISTGGGFNLECNGDSDGTIDLAIAGGTAPFSYSWTTGDGSGLNPTAEDQIGLTAGTYDVTVTDANGCMQMGSYTLTEPTAVAITLDNISMSVGGGFNLDCNGDTDGVIEITPGGGEGGYTYAWTGPGVNPTSQDQSNLGAGSYSVTVTDGNGCTAVANYSLTEPTALNVVATTVTDVSCNGDTDGAIDITVTGGEGVYTFAWSGTGTGIVVGDEDQTGLSAGTYDVTVTDGNGCTFDLLGIVVNEPAAIVITPMLSISTGGGFNLECNGDSDGTIDLAIAGGTAPFSYSWTTGDGSGLNPTAEDQIGLTAGTYDVTVTDANGCMQMGSYTLTEPTAVAITLDNISMSVGGGFNLDCNGDTDGVIEITPGGGEGGYTYAWTGPGVNPTSQDQSNLGAGSYSVTVTDGNGCTAVANYSLTEPTALNVVATTVTDVSCNGDTDGAIDITVTGGEGVYTFAWSGTGTGIVVGDEDQTGLSAGTYDVTVTDGNGCTFDLLGIVVNEPAAIVITPMLSISTGGGFNLECNGDSDGTIDLAIAGGTAPFSYSWTTGDGSGLNPTAEDQIGLTAGTYDVTVTDANGCMQMGSYTLTEPTAVAITLDNISMSVGGGFNLNCNGDSDGVIEITPSGGEGGYTYAWTGPGVNPISQDQMFLGAGSYSVTVTDGNGCTAVANYTLTEPPSLSVIATSITDVTCNGDTDGAIDITASGGEGTYTYSWTGPGVNPTAEDQINLGADTYSVEVTDGNGCTVMAMFTVNEPTLPSQYAVSGGGTICDGDAGLSVVLDNSDTDTQYQLYLGAATVGTPLVGTGSSVDFGLQSAAGTYTIRGVKLANVGCPETDMLNTVDIIVRATPVDFTLSLNSPSNEYCQGDPSTIDLQLSGSQATLLYDLIRDGSTTVQSGIAGTGAVIDFNDLTAGIYTVEAYYSTIPECRTQMSGSPQIIENPLPLDVSLAGPALFDICYNESADVIVQSSQTGILYQLRVDAVDVGTPLLGDGSDLTLNTGLLTSVGNNTLTVLAFNPNTSCQLELTDQFTVDVQPQLNISISSVSPSNTICDGGTITLTASPATYDTYYWFRGASLFTTTAVNTLDLSLVAESGIFRVVGEVDQGTATCQSTRSAPELIVINPLPDDKVPTPDFTGTLFCEGETLTLEIPNSQAGVTYQLLDQTDTPISASIAGLGGGSSIFIDSNNLTTSITGFKVLATETSSGLGCNRFIGTPIITPITVNAIPAKPDITPLDPAAICEGTGNIVLTSTLTAPVGGGYSWYRNGVFVITIPETTGPSITLTSVAESGAWQVSVEAGVAGCASPLSDPSIVEINPLPDTKTVNLTAPSPGNEICYGTTATLQIVSSQIGINYRIRLNSGSGTIVSNDFAGTGSDLSITTDALQAPLIPVPTGFDDYNLFVEAINATTGCELDIDPSLVLRVIEIPGQPGISTSVPSPVCDVTGIDVTLTSDPAPAGGSYLWYKNGFPIAPAVTTQTIDLSDPSESGSYQVQVIGPSPFCESILSSPEIVTINALPDDKAFSIPATPICQGDQILVTIAASQSGVNYQLFDGATPISGSIAGTGVDLDILTNPLTGDFTLTVLATNPVTSCTFLLSSSIMVTVNPPPAQQTITVNDPGSIGTTFCEGDGSIDLQVAGGFANYLWYVDGIYDNSLDGLTSINLSMPSQSGSYQVQVVDANGCISPISVSTIVIINDLPQDRTVSEAPGGPDNVCENDIYSITIENSQSGIIYQLTDELNNPISIDVAGTGSDLNIDTQPLTLPGIDRIRIRATDAITSCTNFLTDEVDITVVPLPAKPVVLASPSAQVCIVDVPITLSADYVGSSYAWFKDGLPLVSGPHPAFQSIDLNTIAESGNYSVQVFETVNSCPSPVSDEITVVINPTPILDPVSDVEACPADAISVSFDASNVTGETFDWTNSNPAIGLPAVGSGDLNFTAAANLTPNDIVATISVTSTLNGCTSSPAETFTITVKPTPVITPQATVIVCPDVLTSPINFTQNTVTPGTETWSWSATNSAGTGVPASGTGPSIPAFTPVANTSGTPELSTVTVSVTKNGCVSADMVFDIIVRSDPTVSVSAVTDQCSGDFSFVSLTVGNGVSGTSFAWTVFNAVNVTGASADNGTLISQQLFNNTNNAGFVEYEITPEANGCFGPSVIQRIDVQPSPVWTVDNNNDVICEDQTTDLVLTSPTVGAEITLTDVIPSDPVNVTGFTPSGTVFNTGLAGGVPINDNIDNNTESPQTVIYVFDIRVGACIEPVSEVVVVTVNPIPTFDVIDNLLPATSICSGEETDYTITTPTLGAVVEITDVTGDIADVSGYSPIGSTFLNGANIKDLLINTTNSPKTITYEFSVSANSCPGVSVINRTITVNPNPVWNVVNNDDEVCGGELTDIDITTPTVGAVVTIVDLTLSETNTSLFNGYSPIGTTFNSFPFKLQDALVNNTAIPQTVTYEFTVSANGCADPVSLFATVTSNPDPVFTATNLDPDGNICSEELTSILLESPTAGAIIRLLTVTPSDPARISGYSAAGTTFLDGSLVTDNLILATGVNTIESVIYEFEVFGNGCSNPVTQSITVNVYPIPDAAAIDNSQEICDGDELVILLVNPNGVDGLGTVTYDWTVTAPPEITGAVAGSSTTEIRQTLVNTSNAPQNVIYDIIPTGPNGCVGESVTAFVIVNPTPSASSDIPGDATTICSPGLITINIDPGPNNVAGTTYNWTVNFPPTIIGAAPGSGNRIEQTLTNTDIATPGVVEYIITPTANGCDGPTRSVFVTVNAVAFLDPGPDQEVCEDVNLINLSASFSGSATSVTWSSPTNPSGSQFSNVNDPNATYTLSPIDSINGGVTLTVMTNDPDGPGPCTPISDTVVITLNRLPDVQILGLAASYAQSDDPQPLLGVPTSGGTFTGNGVNSGFYVPSIVFIPDPDLFVLDTVRHTFTDANGCTNVAQQIVQVFKNPDVSFERAPGLNFCQNEGDINLIEQLLPNPSDGTWFDENDDQIPDGIFNSGGKPVGTYVFKYEVTDAFTGGVTVVPVTINIRPVPRVNFTIADFCAEVPIQLNDSSYLIAGENTLFPEDSINTWTWTETNGSFSVADQNPLVTFATAGDKNITLKVSTNSNCEAQFTRTDYFGKSPTLVDFDWNNICGDDITEFQEGVVFADDGFGNPIDRDNSIFSWDFGDNNSLPGGMENDPVNESHPDGAISGGTYGSPAHQYANAQDGQQYQVTLNVTTGVGCNGVSTKTVNILPIRGREVLPAYEVDFNSSNENWFISLEDDDYIPDETVSSWIYREANGNIISPKDGSGDRAWWTGRKLVNSPSDTVAYFSSDRTVVNGPCFDFTNMNRPMVSFDYWISSDSLSDGAIMEISVDGGNEWFTVGETGQGIKWYNATGVSSRPGQNNVANSAFTGQTGDWYNARYSLDFVDILRRPVTPLEIQKVRFRFQFASSEAQRGDQVDGFAIDNFRITEKERTVLVESFVNTNDQSNYQGYITEINSVNADVFNGDFITINYHVNAEDPDTFYDESEIFSNGRSNNYNINEAGISIIGGTNDINFQGDQFGYRGPFQQINSMPFVDQRSLMDAQFNVTIDPIPQTAENIIQVRWTLEALEDNLTNFRVRTALIEEVAYQADVSGLAVDSAFNILKTMLPVENGASGLLYQNVMNTGDRVSTEGVTSDGSQYLTVDLNMVDFNVYNPTRLGILVFVQDAETNEILQSAYRPINDRKDGSGPVGIEDELTASLEQVLIYPNPVLDDLNLFLDEEYILSDEYSWKIIDQRGIEIDRGVLRFEYGKQVINTDNIPNGIYLVVLGIGEEPLVYKKIAIMHR